MLLILFAPPPRLPKDLSCCHLLSRRYGSRCVRRVCSFRDIMGWELRRVAFAGTIATWVVLTILAQSINIYWLPMMYCIGLTLLEGIFCLGMTTISALKLSTYADSIISGMIYHMDPYQMPQAFCHAQIFVISFAALFLTGVCMTIIIATTTSILWPTSINASPES